jgi:hypothetical protein
MNGILPSGRVVSLILPSLTIFASKCNHLLLLFQIGFNNLGKMRQENGDWTYCIFFNKVKKCSFG